MPEILFFPGRFDGFENLPSEPSAADSERVRVHRVSRPFAEFARIFVAVRAADAELENQPGDGVDLGVSHCGTIPKLADAAAEAGV
jgi:hypothetical protein